MKEVPLRLSVVAVCLRAKPISQAEKEGGFQLVMMCLGAILDLRQGVMQYVTK